MNEEKPKKRGVARRAGIALCWFVVAMLALGYLSRSVSEALKARVETGYMGSSVLDESVEGTGRWIAGDTQLYTTYFARRVTKVYIKAGDWVEPGTPLFAYDVSTVAGGGFVSDRALRAARKALEKAEQALETAEDPAYALTVVESARQALAYAEFTYEQYDAVQHGGVVRATFSGMVVKCDLAVGKSSTGGVTGVEIAPDGVVFTMTVSEKEAEHIAVGDAVTLYTDGKEEKDALTVAGIALPDADGSIAVTCGGGASGHAVNARQEWKIKKQSPRYQQTIPIAALRQGGGEDYYVLLLTEKDTILGTQLVAKKQSVTLLAHDSKTAAVEGSLSERDRLITASTKELKDGDYVVLKDAD